MVLFEFFFGWLCAILFIGIPAAIISDGIRGLSKDIERKRRRRW